jgi:hypothetical protein
MMSYYQGASLHTTRTGRAKPKGKTTRKSLATRRNKYVKGMGQDRPLSLDMQVHPQALTRTPVHPGCRSATRPASGEYVKRTSLSVADLLNGKTLHSKKRTGDWRVMYMGVRLGYAAPAEAMGFRMAAVMAGLEDVEVFQ